MPTFFSFQQGSEDSSRFTHHGNDSTPLLGRFRAVPRPQNNYHSLRAGRARSSSGPLDVLTHGWRGSVHVGYGALLAAAGFDDEGEEEESDETEDEDGDLGGDARTSRGQRVRQRAQRQVRKFWSRTKDVWVTPRQGAVRKVVSKWWSRWTALVLLPALLAVGWCAVPFPKYPLPGEDGRGQPHDPGGSGDQRVPGHGEARVLVNFWFYLFVYYAFYNFTALVWITKVFNLYSLNWWPESLGFPVTVSGIAVLSLIAPIVIYLIPNSRFLTAHNTAWITWTFIIMAMPVAVAFCILMTHERHLGLRHSLSETQRLFTSSWWTGEPETTISRRETRRRQLAALNPEAVDPDSMQIGSEPANAPSGGVGLRRRWLPASFVRFVWFCLALLVGLLAYVIGEAYAELYLRTLPHNNLETIVYVYGWILTVYLLDGLTGWILGGNEGERVGSYPLSWIFKL
jgi:hypothetical protein